MPRDKTGHFYYEWYPTIYQADTLHLTLAQCGAYRRMIDYYVTTRTPIPNDDNAIARILGVGIEEWRLMADIVRKFFKIVENNPLGLQNNPVGFLRHTFCDDLLANHDQRINRAKNNGVKGGRPKKQELKKNNPLGYESETHRKAEQNITEQITTEEKKESKPFALTEESVAAYDDRKEKIVFDSVKGKFSGYEYMLDTWGEGFPAVEIPQEIAKAGAWLLANPKNKKSNYARFLTNWLSRQQDNARPVNGHRGGGNAPAAEPIEDRMARIRAKQAAGVL